MFCVERCSLVDGGWRPAKSAGNGKFVAQTREWRCTAPTQEAQATSLGHDGNDQLILLMQKYEHGLRRSFRRHRDVCISHGSESECATHLTLIFAVSPAKPVVLEYCLRL